MSEFTNVQENFSSDQVKARWGDVFAYEANPPQSFLQELSTVDLERQAELYEKVIRNTAGPLSGGAFEPVAGVADVTTLDPALKEEYASTGLQALADGRLALLILAGGAGTRLGFDHPKMKIFYNLNKPYIPVLYNKPSYF